MPGALITSFAVYVCPLLQYCSLCGCITLLYNRVCICNDRNSLTTHLTNAVNIHVTAAKRLPWI